MAAKYKIRSDYRAAKHGGTRSLAAVKYIVVHDGELYISGGAADAEAMGRYFAGGSVVASPHFGVDNDTIQCYLPITTVGWHCTSFNSPTIGIEQGGRASWSRKQWLQNTGPQLDRVAWLLAYLSCKTGVPLKLRSAAWLKRYGVDPAKRNGGITTHLAHTLAMCPGDHTDPGPGYPMAKVLRRARWYKVRMKLGKA